MTIRHSKEEQAQSLSDYLPSGRAFGSRNVEGSNLRLLLRGLAEEVLRVEEQISLFGDEILPDETTLFLDEWESAVGIPNGCLTGIGSNSERRDVILAKLADMNLQTDQDFIDLAALFGQTITVAAGIDRPDLGFSSDKEARFTIVITFEDAIQETFPYTFPILFGQAELSTLVCLFSGLIPACCQIIFEP